MTLELVFRNGEMPERPVLLPQVAGTGIEPFAASLLSAAGGIRRVLPGPGQKASAPAIRSWHRDAWWALPQVERRSLVLAAGAGAACIAPLLDERAEVVAIVRDPLEVVVATAAAGRRVPARRHLHALADGDARMARRLRAFSNWQARVLLTHREEFDSLPITLGPPPDADRWRELLFCGTLPGVHAVPADQVASEAKALAERLGCCPQAIARVARAAETTPWITPVRLRPDHADLLRQLSWLDTELYERLARSPSDPPKQARGLLLDSA